MKSAMMNGAYWRSPRRRLGIGVLLLAVAVIGASMIAWARQGSVSAPTISATTLRETPLLAAPQSSAQVRLEAEHVTLRSTGFEPNEFTRPAGRFLLSIDNKAEAGELTFQLLREDGSLERELPARQDKFRLRQVVELGSGRYALVVVNHPEWACRITIQ